MYEHIAYLLDLVKAIVVYIIYIIKFFHQYACIMARSDFHHFRHAD